MKNYKVDIVINSVPNYDLITIAKILSSVVARNAILYSIDYHGYDHGIFIGSEKDVYYINIIINGVDGDWNDGLEDEIFNSIKALLAEYDISDVIADVEVVGEPIEIPDNYTEQYYFEYYKVKIKED